MFFEVYLEWTQFVDGGDQCAQFVVSIHFDLFRQFNVCLTDRLASLKVFVDVFLCFAKGQGLGPIWLLRV